MRSMRRNAGFILIGMYLVIMVLIILAGVVLSYALSDLRSSQRLQANVQSLYLAEAGVDQAIVRLRQDYGWSTGFTEIPVNNAGSYSVQVGAAGADRRILTAQGRSALLAGPVERRVEVIVRRVIPPGFFDNAIWAAEELDFNGNVYSVVGNVVHADENPSGGMGGVSGTVTYNPAASPLPRLSFQQLHDIAQAQGNLYDAQRLAQGPDAFPDSFWYRPPTDPSNPATGIPNVNYITTDLVLNGNIGTIGGFFVVVGNVLTNPGVAEDTTINGNGQVAGAIYTTGDFRVNGGGNGLNVDGGVWAGHEARLNGNATIRYNSDYMKAIRALGVNADVQALSWREPT